MLSITYAVSLRITDNSNNNLRYSLPGTTVHFKGTFTANGQPLANGTGAVLIYIGGQGLFLHPGATADFTTDASGNFDYVLTVPSVFTDSNAVTHYLNGGDYPWQVDAVDPSNGQATFSPQILFAIPRPVQIVNLTATPPQVATGSPVSISFNLTYYQGDTGDPHVFPNASVNINIDGGATIVVVTDTSGKALYAYTPNSPGTHTIIVTFPGLNLPSGYGIAQFSITVLSIGGIDPSVFYVIGGIGAVALILYAYGRSKRKSRRKA